MNEALADYRESLKAVRANYAEPGKDVDKDKMDEFRAEVDTLLDQEIEVDIRQINKAMLAHSEEKRPEFSIPQDDVYIAWYLFDFGDE